MAGWRRGSRGNVRVDFRDVVPEPLLEGAYAYPVERMKFDKLLLDNARRTGVDVAELAGRPDVAAARTLTSGHSRLPQADFRPTMYR